MKIAITAILFFTVGYLAHLAFHGPLTIRSHWQAIDRYNEYLLSGQKPKRNSSTGPGLDVPVDIRPHLAALIAAGELNYADLVLPTVPYCREANHHWMQLGPSLKELVYMEANHRYTAFQPAGEQPLHLNIWYRNDGEHVVQNLVRELEERFGGQSAAQE